MSGVEGINAANLQSIVLAQQMLAVNKQVIDLIQVSQTASAEAVEQVIQQAVESASSGGLDVMA